MTQNKLCITVKPASNYLPRMPGEKSNALVVFK